MTARELVDVMGRLVDDREAGVGPALLERACHQA
jgi:hypothetical protein